MSAPPYDTLFEILTAANTRLNGSVETLSPIGGQIVGNTNAFSQQVCNDAFRKMQNKLADLRYSGLQQETVFTNVPAVASNDPMVQAYIGYNGYFDGVVLHTSPVLPQNMIRPYDLTERQNGSGSLFTDMDPFLWSLPRVPKANWNRSWLWRNDTLYFPGALVNTDLSLLYAGFLSDFADGSPTVGLQWFQQPVQIMYCLDSFADYICREICVARGDQAGAAAFQLSAEANARLIINRDMTAGKSIAKYAEFQRMADSYTPDTGPDTSTVKR